MIHVCDACMGSGKSSAAINYMNEHKDKRFIYITPYLDEAARIKESCPELSFAEPNNKIPKYEFKKVAHTAALIKDRRNITTTHQAFKGYTPDMLDMIRENDYTLIIDENVDVLESAEFDPGDLEMFVDAGYVKEDSGAYTLTGKEYRGTALRGVYSLMKTRQLFKGDGDDVFIWALPPELLTAAKEVFILTYLFKGQSLHHLLEMNSIPYDYIGIDYNGGNYRFSDTVFYTPDYIYTLGDKIHICGNDRMNSIGDEYYDISLSWFKREPEGVEQLKRNISNWFKHMNEDVPAKNKLWGTFADTHNKLSGKGYTNAFLIFNAKASNLYKSKTCLAYAANIFMNVNEQRFYESFGIEIDRDTYALSNMVQWIWRSAIREGVDIDIYIPSKRMREMLISWIGNISEGGNNIVGAQM